MTTSSKVRLLVIGSTLFWWIPCFFLTLKTHIWLGLLWPFLGFYPGAASDSDPGYSEPFMGLWGCLSLVVFLTLAFYALRKNSQASAIACTILISLSSLFVIGRGIWFLIQEQR